VKEKVREGGTRKEVVKRGCIQGGTLKQKNSLWRKRNYPCRTSKTLTYEGGGQGRAFVWARKLGICGAEKNWGAEGKNGSSIGRGFSIPVWKKPERGGTELFVSKLLRRVVGKAADRGRAMHPGYTAVKSSQKRIV